MATHHPLKSLFKSRLLRESQYIDLSNYLELVWCRMFVQVLVEVFDLFELDFPQSKVLDTRFRSYFILSSYRTFKAEISTKEYQWCCDTKPKCQQRDECGKWNCSGASIGPKNKIQNEKDTKNHTKA